ncbi:pseudouridine synthase [Inhella gelatinilytica]|uniref:Dual-specificity RNA pseudouridine synthase RluF n=1 Tax=Inhella gelatinilytica TaxID=2795030 RepID=A0A931IXV7_9BURK|nr:pseudouridine synthase [Inhella gelatinilytica]MBH9553020.1 pseudouridine synthase [Inhella gelatinilytica]
MTDDTKKKSTLSLKIAAKPRNDRAPVRGINTPKKRPTLAEAQAERERRDRQDRQQRSDRPRDERGGFGGPRREDRAPFGDRRDFGDRPHREDRAPFGDRPRREDRAPFGDRPRRPEGQGFGGPRGERSDRGDRGERRDFGDRPRFDDRPRRDERPPFGDRPRREDRVPFGDRPRRPEGQGFGGPRGERTDRGERRDFGDRPRREDRAPFGDRPRRPEGQGFGGPRGERTDRGERRDFGDRPRFDDRPRRDERPPFGDRPRREDRAPFGDRPRRPEGQGFGGPRGERSDRGERRDFGDRSRFDDRPRRDERPQWGDRPHREDRAPRERWADNERIAPEPRGPSVAPERQNFSADGERLSKVMAERGQSSRREADDWIAAGWVKVDGKMAVLGQRVGPDAVIEIDPAAHKQQAKQVTILLHKPIGVVSGQPEDGYEPAVSLIRADSRWAEDPTQGHVDFNPAQLRGLAPAGRLDIDSTGLLVFTQDGRIAKALIGDESDVEKEYLVRVAVEGAAEGEHPMHTFPEAQLARLNHGLELDGVQLREAKVSWANEDQLRFVLREGRKRQIRRMCELVGLKVVALKRVRMGRIPLSALPMGQWRYLAPWEKF